MINGKLHIGTNLKMYKTIRETTEFLKTLQELTADIAQELCLFVIPSYTSLQAATEAVDQSRIRLGAQNMHWEERGQFTGEVSPLMLQELKLQIVEIGHSERRHVFRETDLEENKKVLSALEHGFTPLLCIGETGEDKELEIGDERLRQQLKIGLHGVTEAQASKIWVAYEPVWAIGVNGIPARPDYANLKHQVIRKALQEIFPSAGNTIPILYGGSVNQDNACSLINQAAIDGLFIGRAAWNVAEFNKLIREVLPIWWQKLSM